MNTKTLIITQALAAVLLSIADNLAKTTRGLTFGYTRPGDPLDIALIDGFRITHENAGNGPQSVIVDRIHRTCFAVSFVGSDEYLERIRSEGWKSSAEALANYLAELNPDADLDLSRLNYLEIGDDYVAYTLDEDDAFDVNDTELSSLFIEKVVTGAAEDVNAMLQPAAEEMLRTVEDAVQDVVIAETASVDSQVEEAQAHSEGRPTWRQRSMKFLGSPMGIATCVVVGGVMLLVAKTIANHIPLAEYVDDLSVV